MAVGGAIDRAESVRDVVVSGGCMEGVDQSRDFVSVSSEPIHGLADPPVVGRIGDEGPLPVEQNASQHSRSLSRSAAPT